MVSMEKFEVYMYTPIHLSYSLDEVFCKFNFSGFDPLPPKNQKPQKILFLKLAATIFGLN
jgi:hypothetical protein